MHGYFKMSNVKCRTISNAFFFIYKTHVHTISMTSPHCIHTVAGHHMFKCEITVAVNCPYRGKRRLIHKWVEQESTHSWLWDQVSLTCPGIVPWVSKLMESHMTTNPTQKKRKKKEFHKKFKPIWDIECNIKKCMHINDTLKNISPVITTWGLHIYFTVPNQHNIAWPPRHIQQERRLSYRTITAPTANPHTLKESYSLSILKKEKSSSITYGKNWIGKNWTTNQPERSQWWEKCLSTNAPMDPPRVRLVFAMF